MFMFTEHVDMMYDIPHLLLTNRGFVAVNLAFCQESSPRVPHKHASQQRTVTGVLSPNDIGSILVVEICITFRRVEQAEFGGV